MVWFLIIIFSYNYYYYYLIEKRRFLINIGTYNKHLVSVSFFFLVRVLLVGLKFDIYLAVVVRNLIYV